jgi:hypothetical protein
MHINKLIVPTLFIALAGAPFGSARAEQQTVEVEGVAAVVNNDIGMARDKALDDAKRKAVEQVGGTHIKSESVTENMQLVEERVYAKASGFVKNFQIKNQYKDGETYFVKISATVDAGAVADSIDQLFKVKPRVVVLVAEQNVGASSFSYWWGQQGFSSEMDLLQNALIAAWQPKGYKFIEPGMLHGKLKIKKPMQTPNLDDKNALVLSKDADADIAIVGKVVVTDAGPVMDGVKMRSFHAVGNLRVLNVDTGEIIAVADDTAVAPHIDGNTGGRLAIKALADKVGDALQQSIMKRWTAEAAGSKTIEVVVDGNAKPALLRDLKRFFETEVRGVERVDERRRHKGQAFFDVQIRGEVADLVKGVEAKTFDGAKLTVSGHSKAKLTLEVGE